MALRRVAKSAVNWTQFAERVAPTQMGGYRVLKAKTDMLVSRVSAHPDALPAIDWAYYQKHIPNAALVQKFKTVYETTEVEYPEDVNELKNEIHELEQEALGESSELVCNLQEEAEIIKRTLAAFNTLPPADEMTQEMYAMYFPAHARQGTTTVWPHSPWHQPASLGGTDPEEIDENTMSVGGITQQEFILFDKVLAKIKK